MYEQFLQKYQAEKDLYNYPLEWKPESNRGNFLRLNAAISIDGVLQEGLNFYGRTTIDTPDRNVTLGMAFTSLSGRGVQLYRAEWRPISGHNNRGFGPQDLQHVEQTSSHCHDLVRNKELGGDIWRVRGLPLALPIQPEPQTFSAFLEFVGETLNLLNVSSVPEPPWTLESQPDLGL